MNKKQLKETYETPAIEVIDIQVEQNIMAASGPDPQNREYRFETSDMGGEDW